MREELANHHQNPGCEVLTAEHVAEMLEVHVRTVAKLVVLTAFRHGGSVASTVSVELRSWPGWKSGRRAPVRMSSRRCKPCGESEEIDMGVFERRRRSGTVYYVSFVWNGHQVQERAGTDKRQALQLERQRKREVRDGTYHPDNKSGSTTLANYMDGWLQARRGRGIRTVADDETRLRMHIVPHLGCKRLDSITRRNVLDVIERLRSDRRLAPKTIRNVYGTLRTLFRDALLEELMTIDPCILPRGALPSPREMSPSATRRKPSVFSREEIRLLLTDQQVPADRRMLYSLLFLAGVRHGEAVGRRWRDLDESALPLGTLSVATQYRDEPLKAKTPRVVPVHPVLAELLTAWKCSGFKQFFLREPRPEDFIVPSRTWRCRMSGTSHKGPQDDCKAIGIPGRRVHDTRHTFISLAGRGGARKDVLERITHSSTGDIVDRYTTFDWAPLCEAVTSLRLQLNPISQSESVSSCGSSTR